MDGSFVSELHQQMRRPVSLQCGNEFRLVAPNDWKDLTPKQAQLQPLVGTTLAGLVGYILHEMDSAILERPFCFVGPRCVLFTHRAEPESEQFRRHVFYRAEVDHTPFPFGQYLDAEEFFVGLQSQFVPTADLVQLLELLASIRESVVRETTDNGVGQEVVASKGVVLKTTARVPNPVSLRPYRTFPEVAQPESRFTLRLRSSGGDRPQCALFESDGGLWKIDAISVIKDYLKANVEVPVIG